jgi:hypothetical protein
MSSFAVAVNPTRTGRVGDAELIGMKEKGVCICDIELLLFSHEPGPLARKRLHEALTEGAGEVIVFFFCEMSAEGIFSLEPF